MNSRKVGQHHGDLKSALIQSALELLEEGQSSPSMREIARRAGVSPSAPYHHFGDHAGLLSAVASQGFELLRQAVQESTQGKNSPQENLRSVTETYVIFSMKHEAHYRTMFDPNRTEHTEELDASARVAFGNLVHAIAQVRPDLKKEDLLRCARQSWSIAHGAILLGFDDLLSRLEGPSSAEAIADEVCDAIAKLVEKS